MKEEIDEGQEDPHVSGISSLNHTIEQENYFFYPHLHPVGKQKFVVYGILIPVFGSISVVFNFIVYLTLFYKNKKTGKSFPFEHLQLLQVNFNILLNFPSRLHCP